MLDGIEMDVVDVAPEIGVIADRMFPIPTLPNPFFSLGDLAGAAFDVGSQAARKSALDESLAQRKVCIARREGPDGTEMSGSTQTAVDSNGYLS